MGIVYPDYTHSIVNLASSLLKAYGAKSVHNSLPVLDQALQESHKNRVFLILDGMGHEFLQSRLEAGGLFRRNEVDVLTSVYPCTTTAATTSMLSGLTPYEHGWLGWSPWFREYGRIIDVFLDRDSLSGQDIKPPASELLAYQDLGRLIYDATRGTVGLHRIQPNFAPDGVNTFDEVIERIEAAAARPGPQLVMAYWHQPDSRMHAEGPGSDGVRSEVMACEAKLEDLMARLKDTLLVVSADHGQVTVEHERYFDDYPDLLDCLVVPPSLETRAVSFFVKSHRREEFAKRFNAVLGSEFLLLTRETVLDQNLFGIGQPHVKVDDFLGDFLACATGSSIIRFHGRFERPHHVFRGHHAGLRSEEMLVPLILVRSQ